MALRVASRYDRFPPLAARYPEPMDGVPSRSARLDVAEASVRMRVSPRVEFGARLSGRGLQAIASLGNRAEPGPEGDVCGACCGLIDHVGHLHTSRWKITGYK